jgi:hypothetical protein
VKPSTASLDAVTVDTLHDKGAQFDGGREWRKSGERKRSVGVEMGREIRKLLMVSLVKRDASNHLVLLFALIAHS